MSVWIIEPRDPLIVRDGRPFGPNPGARAKTLSFPFPATIAGGVRTRAGQDGAGVFDTTKIKKVKGIRIRGPLLVDLADGMRWMVPAPKDALLLRPKDSEDINRHWMRPLLLEAGIQMNLPAELSYPPGLPHPDNSKPYKDAPHFWYWDAFEAWLLNPADDSWTEETLPDLGHSGPTADSRMHVAIDPATLTGQDGALFMTSGLAFQQERQTESVTLTKAGRLGLAVAVDNLQALSLSNGLAPLGGERRIMQWYESQGASDLPTMPDDIKERVLTEKHCRVVLLTPACFEAGWKPHYLCQQMAGVTPTLQAAAVGKPQTISGWDFEKREPKATRRLAPAGSVYYLKLDGEPADIEKWLEAIWMRCVSDAEEDRWAGFGLAAVGTWDGTAETLEIEEANNGA